MKEILIVLIPVGLTLWGMFFILGIVCPVRPFSGRKGAAKSLGLTGLLFIAAAFLVAAHAPETGLPT